MAATSRRSSATRELYLTKYYFYQHQLGESATLESPESINLQPDFGQKGDVDNHYYHYHNHQRHQHQHRHHRLGAGEAGKQIEDGAAYAYDASNDEADDDDDGDDDDDVVLEPAGCCSAGASIGSGCVKVCDCGCNADKGMSPGNRVALQSPRSLAGAGCIRRLGATCSRQQQHLSVGVAQSRAIARRQQVAESAMQSRLIQAASGGSDNSSTISSSQTASLSRAALPASLTNEAKASDKASNQSNSGRCSLERKISLVSCPPKPQHQPEPAPRYHQLQATHSQHQAHQFRRNSSPQFSRQPSIEEQLKRLLAIEPAQPAGLLQTKAEPAEASPRTPRRTPEATRTEATREAMKKSGKLGAGRDEQAAGKRQQSFSDSAWSSSISPDDRLMIFMLASRSTNTNSTVERNARILKWMNNCRDAAG